MTDTNSADSTTSEPIDATDLTDADATDRVAGLHHVTAIAGEANRNVDFYADVLGLRLVKRTVNFDAPDTYHLYYGDETGTPGTVLTFFPFGAGREGRVGRGQTSATAFVVPADALAYWTDRLREAGANVGDPVERFGETVLPFTDAEGQPLELVATDDPDAATDVDPWDDGPVPTERAVRGFHGVSLLSAAPAETGRVLEAMGYERVGSEADPAGGERVRYEAAGERASRVDVLDRPDAPAGRQGAGTVHHVAFRVPDDEVQRAFRKRLGDAGLHVTEQKDRQYFRSVYFREPGGVLFELATEGPGFTRDEDRATLGSTLKLPPWLEADREAIESRLPTLSSAATVVDD